jgi:GT2 family glycosyltransferase
MTEQFESHAADHPVVRPRQVSVLIVNYNGSKLLSDCLKSLKVSIIERKIVVVDNGSTDESVEVLKQFPEVNVVRSGKNLGFAGGNNLGLKDCHGDYVLLLNNDTIVTSGFLEFLCEYLDRNPQVGAVQGKMVLPRHGNSLDVCGSFFTSLGLPYHYGYFKADGPKYQRSYPVFSGKGACLMFRRELIEKVGGFLFDEQFFCYYEESDFCHRVWLAGYEVHFVPSPPIQHLMGATGDQLLKQDVIQQYYVRNMMFSLLGNLSPASIIRIGSAFFLVLIVQMARFLIKIEWAMVRAYFGAFAYNFRHWKRIKARRQLIRNIRKSSDREIFAKVLRTPRLEYFKKTSQGRIRDYVDEDLTATRS